jgi:glyoxylase-like metal-dependent hydrolase (beta-lactamase superfamily II)
MHDKGRLWTEDPDLQARERPVPGHSPDSLSFYCGEGRTPISGDLILKKEIYPDITIIAY